MFGSSANFELNYLKDKNALIECMVVHGNSLWIGTNNGLYEINSRNFSASKFYTVKNSKLPSPQINFLYSDKYNVLWVGTQNGVLRIDGDDWRAYEKKSMEGIFENKEGLWLLNEEELWNIDNVDKYNRWYRANLKDGLKKGMVNDIVVDSEDRLIIASDILVRFDPYGEKIERYGKDLGLIAQKCLALEIDEDNKLWIGTEKQGLFTVGFKERERIRKSYEPMEYALVAKSPTCNGQSDGSVKLNLKGGKPPYKINWSNGAKDIKHIDGLKAGQYRVTVVDDEKDSLSHRITLIEPRKLSIDLSEMNIDEFQDGISTTLFAFDGGTPGYLLDINGISSVNPVGNLTPGDHTATVTDIMGCKASVDFTMEGETSLSKLDASSMTVGQVVRIDKLYFATDSTQVTTRALSVLNEVYEFLNANQKIVIEIGGHTNGLPPHEYCDKLSTERARNVAEHLVNRGIESGRIQYKGYGKRAPIASNDTMAGRKKNQRVEIKILSLGE